MVILCALVMSAILSIEKKVHLPWLQWLYNRTPFFIKKKIVSKIQSDIKQDKNTKSLEIMDVTPSEVESVMEKHNVDLMIHAILIGQISIASTAQKKKKLVSY